MLSEYFYLAKLTNLDGTYLWPEEDLKRVVDKYEDWIKAQRNPDAYGIKGPRKRHWRTLEDSRDVTAGSRIRGRSLKGYKTDEAKSLSRMAKEELISVALSQGRH